jgi:two-component system LytT family response regulator
MRALRVIVVEDQVPARDHLVALLAAEPGVQVVAACGDGAAAVQAIRSQPVELVLLDVQLPECDGFEVIRRVGPDQMPAVVFVTAFDRHAVRAFDAQAHDYLLKPFTTERVRRALRLVRDRLAARETNPARSRPTLAIRQRRRTLFVAVADIECVLSRGNDALVCTASEAHRSRGTLERLHARLGGAFVRTHRSALVNVAHAEPALLVEHGALRVRVRSGRAVPVSESRRADVERALQASAGTRDPATSSRD